MFFNNVLNYMFYCGIFFKKCSEEAVEFVGFSRNLLDSTAIK